MKRCLQCGRIQFRSNYNLVGLYKHTYFNLINIYRNIYRAIKFCKERASFTPLFRLNNSGDWNILLFVGQLNELRQKIWIEKNLVINSANFMFWAFHLYYNSHCISTCSGTVGWDKVLQDWRLRVRFTLGPWKFSSDLLLRSAFSNRAVH